MSIVLNVTFLVFLTNVYILFKIRLFKSGLSKHILAEFILAFVTITYLLYLFQLRYCHNYLLFSPLLYFFFYDYFLPIFISFSYYYSSPCPSLIYLMVILLLINIFLPDYLFFHYIFVSLLSSPSYYLSPY